MGGGTDRLLGGDARRGKLGEHLREPAERRRGGMLRGTALVREWGAVAVELKGCLRPGFQRGRCSEKACGGVSPPVG